MTSNLRQVLIYLALGLALLTAPAVGWVEVGGEISSDTTWTMGDTVNITSPVSVDSEATLTVEAGVVVLFNLNLNLVIRGSLQATGEPEAPILFTSVGDTIGGTPNTASWSGIEIRESAGTLLRHCTVRYAIDAVYTNNSEIDLEFCTIENFRSRGVYVAGDPEFGDHRARLECCTIRQSKQSIVGSGTALYLHKAGVVEVEHSHLIDCEYGMRVYGYQSFQPRFDLDNCQIAGNLIDGILVYTGG